MTNVVRSDEMPDEIDFSGGIRGRFYRSGVRLNLPIYLDSDVLSYLSQVAAKKGATRIGNRQRSSKEKHRNYRIREVTVRSDIWTGRWRRDEGTI